MNTTDNTFIKTAKHIFKYGASCAAYHITVKNWWGGCPADGIDKPRWHYKRIYWQLFIFSGYYALNSYSWFLAPEVSHKDQTLNNDWPF